MKTRPNMRTKALTLRDPNELLGWLCQAKVLGELRRRGIGSISYNDWIQNHQGGVDQIDHCPHGMFQKNIAAQGALPTELLLKSLPVRNP